MQLGPYLLEIEESGVRISRRDGAASQAPTARLTIVGVDGGGNRVHFTLGEMKAQGGSHGAAEFIGWGPGGLSLEGGLAFSADLDGFSFWVEIVNAKQDQDLRLEVVLTLLGEVDPHWLIPGLFYGDNRLPDCQRLYPAYSEIRRDAARLVSNHWMFSSDRSSLPVVFCSTFNVCAFLATHESLSPAVDNPLGFSQTAVGFSSEGDHPELMVSVPVVEEPVRFSFTDAEKPTPLARIARLRLGERVRLEGWAGLRPLQGGRLGGAWIPAYRALCAIFGRSHPLPPSRAFDAERLAGEGLMRWHYDSRRGMIHELSVFDRHFGMGGTNTEVFQMHAGWMSGALPAYALLWRGREAGDVKLIDAARRTLDRVTGEISPCGSIWPLYVDGDGYRGGYGPQPGLAHARTVAESVLFIMRALRLELAFNASHPEWFAAARSTIEFALKSQAESGSFPTYWSPETGQALAHDSCAGMCWIGPMAAFARLTSDALCREAVTRAGEYYAQFIEDEFLYGCVEDLPLTPTADDCHWAVISYLLLYDVDHDKKWLELARRAADLALTWRMAYNTTFHPDSMLGRAQLRTRGADISSVAAPTLGPSGLISYGEMLRLSQTAGDPYYAARTREGRLYAEQLPARLDGEFNARSGQMLSRIFHTEWWQPKGMALSLSFAMSGGLLQYAELLERHAEVPEQAADAGRSPGARRSAPLASTTAQPGDEVEIGAVRRPLSDTEILLSIRQRLGDAPGETPEAREGSAIDESFVAEFGEQLEFVIGESAEDDLTGTRAIRRRGPRQTPDPVDEAPRRISTPNIPDEDGGDTSELAGEMFQRMRRLHQSAESAYEEMPTEAIPEGEESPSGIFQRPSREGNPLSPNTPAGASEAPPPPFSLRTPPEGVEIPPDLDAEAPGSGEDAEDDDNPQVKWKIF